jgi:hypothetical protein
VSNSFLQPSMGIQFLRLLVLLKRSLQDDDDLFYDGIESLCYVFLSVCVCVCLIEERFTLHIYYYLFAVLLNLFL